MLNRGFRILWLKVNVNEKKHIHFSFPLPLFIFQDLFDSILDLMTFLSLFVPRKPVTVSSSGVGIHQVREITLSILTLVDSLTEGEPYELVDVSAENVRVSVKIR
jgi:hypothetical protein